MNLILLGAPGAGKGTQGVLLAEKLDLERISTGDLLREAVHQGTPLGAKAKGFMDAGELVPDSVVLDLVREVVGSVDFQARGGQVRARSGRGGAGFIFDGFPRTRAQAEGLDALLAELARPLDAVVVIDVPDEVLVKRLAGRRSCADCGAIYNIHLNPPEKQDTCDTCGATLIHRSDDEPATVRRRLAVYREQTAPLIDYYAASVTPVRYVQGNGPVDDIHRQIIEILGT